MFKPGYEATAVKAFTFAGTRFARGERFPYRDLGVIDFDLRGLWMAELLVFSDQPYAVAAKSVAKPAQQNQPPRR